MTDNHNHQDKEKKTRWVVLLTAITMVVEIIYGLLTGSMALLADGIHMGSHVLAIGLSWLAYVIIRRLEDSKKLGLNSEKLLSLSGYTSGLLLLVFSGIIIFEAVQRFLSPIDIQYKEAIFVAGIGLVVNILSAFILHHDHDHSDVNIRAAYLHVLADALTSLSAIVGLIAAMVWDLVYVDTIAAIVSSLVIIKWSVGLLKKSGRSLVELKYGTEH
ncbi:MAG: cation diffusion facilitator family transporter [Bacteroidales bacterium]|nr:cation diffusion facilitator family transporter [Bacteroidales bacterium]MCF8457593.1 cation diffusion facilitator family transporter [Bacteroidales bacterium]